MSAGHRWLLALSLAIIVTGLAGAATLHPGRDRPAEAAGHSDHGSGPGGLAPGASYPAAAAPPVFEWVDAALQACPEFALNMARTPVVVPLNAVSMPPLANASRLCQGRFRVAGRMEQLDVALVLDGQDVLALVCVDTVAASAAPVATLRAAVAKLV